MNFSKWIGAAIGWSLGGPIGAILGMVLGSVVDGFSKGTIKVDRQQTYQRTNQTQPGDNQVRMLILASILTKTDGKQHQPELDFVRQQFIGMSGKDPANHASNLFTELNKHEIPLRQVSLP